jgi:hypothetical protein
MESRKRRVRIAIFIGYLILGFLAVFIMRFHPVDRFPPSTLFPRPTQTRVSQAFQFAVPTAGFPGVVIGISKIGDQIIAVADWICVDIEQEFFWKPGEYWNGDTTTPKVAISVNGVAVTELRRSNRGVLTLHTNEAGEVIGTHGDLMESCFQPEAITPQRESNTVLVSVVHHSETLYSGSWELILKK